MYKTRNTSSGDVFSYYTQGSDRDYSIQEIKNKINSSSIISPRFKLYILNPDETVKTEIPEKDILVGGSFNENYQNGQRRSLSVSLYNYNKKYTPSINNLWVGTKIKLEIGMEFDNAVVWFPRGVYVITNINSVYQQGTASIAVEASDKFFALENGAGALDTTYSIPVGSDIRSVITDLLHSHIGNGNVLDPIEIVYNSFFKDKKTQATITKEVGDTIGSILIDLATQLNAEIFYDVEGHLNLIPIQEVVWDENKPIIYSYNRDDDMGGLDLSFNLNEIVNKIIVIGSTNNGETYKGIAVNDDVASPLCYQRIGYRTASAINDSNITSQILAQERAEYELRQKIILKSNSNIVVRFNPLLFVNNLIMISNEFYGLEQARFLIQSISYEIGYSGTMNLGISNIENFSFLTKGRVR